MNLLEKLKQLDKEATPGPWMQWFTQTSEQEAPDGTKQNLIHAAAPPHVLDLNDDTLTKVSVESELIATTRNSLPDIIRLIEAANAAVIHVAHQDKSAKLGMALSPFLKEGE